MTLKTAVRAAAMTFTGAVLLASCGFADPPNVPKDLRGAVNRIDNACGMGTKYYPTPTPRELRRLRVDTRTLIASFARDPEREYEWYDDESEGPAIFTMRATLRESLHTAAANVDCRPLVAPMRRALRQHPK